MENNFLNRIKLFFAGILFGILFGVFGNITDGGLSIILYVVAGIFLAGSVCVPIVMVFREWDN